MNDLGLWLVVFLVVATPVLAGALLIWAMRAATPLSLGRKPYPDVATLVRDVTRLTGLRLATPAGIRSLKQARFEGEHRSGRTAKIAFEQQEYGDGSARNVLLTVSAHEVPWQTFTSSTSAAVENLSPGARRILEGLLRGAVLRVDLAGDVVKVTALASQLEPFHYRIVLDALADLASAVEKPSVDVQVHAADSTKVRCAYCHGDLVEADLVACEQCGTRLHGACWEENGGCPTLGCTGRKPARVGVR